MKLRSPATIDDIVYVLAHLWLRGEEEIALLGLTKAVAQRLMGKFLHSGPSWCILDEDEPIAVVGIDGMCTWFQATTKAENRLGLTKIMRKVVSAFPKGTMTYSLCLHPAAPKWFKAIGLVETGRKGNLRIFIKE